MTSNDNNPYYRSTFRTTGTPIGRTVFKLLYMHATLLEITKHAIRAKIDKAWVKSNLMIIRSILPELFKFASKSKMACRRPCCFQNFRFSAYYLVAAEGLILQSEFCEDRPYRSKVINHAFDVGQTWADIPKFYSDKMSTIGSIAPSV